MLGILRGLAVTMRHTFRKRVTYPYPDKPIAHPARFRGFLRIKGFWFEEPRTPHSRTMPPCNENCPAHVDARGYINLIGQGRYADAYLLHLKNNPLPACFGRMCYAPCEPLACTRDHHDGALAIKWLKRFFADPALEMIERGELEFPKPPIRKDQKAAVIGSGPGGLSCAYYLSMAGYQVTIFEKMHVAGGMMILGIPSYRLPRDILQKEIDLILSTGIEIKYNQALGRDFSLDDLFAQGFGAVFLGMGSHIPLELGIPGEDLEGVWRGEHFLAKVNLGEQVDVGKRVAIIGAGNTAMDCSRVAKRLGAEVSVLYRRSQKEMPALPMEYEETHVEGIDFQWLVAPTAFLGENGRVTGVQAVRMTLGPPDATGRRRPAPVEGSEFTLPVDMVLTALGRKPSWMENGEGGYLAGTGIELTKRGTIKANLATGETTRPGVFAGGDAIRGAVNAITAIGDGHRAAVAMDRYLSGQPIGEVDIRPREKIDQKPRFHFGPRAKPPELPLDQRTGFNEIESRFPEDVGRYEADRCLSCETQECIGCAICATVCPDHCIYITVTQNGQRHINEFMIDHALCSYCGMCSEACPTKCLLHTRKIDYCPEDINDLIFDKKKLWIPDEELARREAGDETGRL